MIHSMMESILCVCVCARARMAQFTYKKVRVNDLYAGRDIPFARLLYMYARAHRST